MIEFFIQICSLISTRFRWIVWVIMAFEIDDVNLVLSRSVLDCYLVVEINGKCLTNQVNGLITKLFCCLKIKTIVGGKNVTHGRFIRAISSFDDVLVRFSDGEI